MNRQEWRTRRDTMQRAPRRALTCECSNPTTARVRGISRRCYNTLYLRTRAHPEGPALPTLIDRHRNGDEPT